MTEIIKRIGKQKLYSLDGNQQESLYTRNMFPSIKGSESLIYQVQDTDTNLLYLGKTPTKASDPVARQRLFAEGSLLEQLSDTDITPPFVCFQIDGTQRPYLVMKDMRQLGYQRLDTFSNRHKWEEHEFSQLLIGLDECASVLTLRSILHRDFFEKKLLFNPSHEQHPLVIIGFSHSSWVQEQLRLHWSDTPWTPQQSLLQQNYSRDIASLLYTLTTRQMLFRTVGDDIESMVLPFLDEQRLRDSNVFPWLTSSQKETIVDMYRQVTKTDQVKKMIPEDILNCWR